MPKYADGSGHCWISASEKTFGTLYLDELPWGDGRPLEAGHPGGNVSPATRALRGGNKTYRVRMVPPDGWTHEKDPTLSFQLSSGHVNQTLYFLAEFWRQMGVPFVGIANKHGNTFRPAIYQGTGLAYLSHK